VDLRQLHKKSYVLNQAVSSVSPLKHALPATVLRGSCSCRVCLICCVCCDCCVYVSKVSVVSVSCLMYLMCLMCLLWRGSGVGHHGGDRHEQAQGNPSNHCSHTAETQAAWHEWETDGRVSCAWCCCVRTS
jgi:hypothetical protein